MKRSNRKPETRRKEHDASENHWLQEGTAGQESLLLELDPFLFAADQTISTLSSSIAFNFEPDDYEKPFAVLVPPDGAIGWPLGYLSKHYNTYLALDDEDELACQAADRFNAKIIPVESRLEVEHDISFYLNTRLSWRDFAHLAQIARAAFQLLRDDGLACFVLPALKRGAKTLIQWGANEPTDFSLFSSAGVLSLPEPKQVHNCVLSEIDPIEQLPHFLKRNREFFGRNTRELFLERMQEADFRDCFAKCAEDKLVAVVVVWTAVERP